MDKLNSAFLSLSKNDAIKALWMLILSTITGFIGDAILQMKVTGAYSLTSIHWNELGAAILLVIITYIQKQFGSNSKGDFAKKEPVNESESK